ncbi:hypothetical protein [Bacillus atrophaeus]|uniref:hypothetical protein n=1 Tax=Bacillus atrophaeus TaxID=1452 RepID=UPI0021637C89|nr:hypothetical protein [Bacillus atrophaeus]
MGFEYPCKYVTVKQEVTGVPVTILKTPNEVGRSLISEEKNKPVIETIFRPSLKTWIQKNPAG